ncbi:MAG: hypothetical protein ACFFD8_00120 [Candidatus Thorarchaeota archaeon]
MRIDLDLAVKHLKCKPWRKITDSTISSPDQIIDHWLPPILPQMIREDFIEFFISKLTGKIGWLRSRIDSSFTKFKVDFRPGGYRGLPDFIEWDSQLDGQFLERMFSLLQSIAQCTSSLLTVEQFYMLSSELCKFTSFSLTSPDISIIKTFCQMPMITIPALARILGMSYKKTRNRWNRLRKLNICRITAKANYRLLGLIPVFIELHDLTRTIRSPYILSQIELSGNSNSTLYLVVVPEEKLGTLSKFLHAHFGSTHTLYVVDDLGQAIEFTHYQIKSGNWNIDWRKLFIGAHLLHNDYNNPNSPSLPAKKHPTRLYLPDTKDKKLIPVLMADARVKLEKLAKIAGMSISQASRRKSKLIELGVLQPEPLIRRVGLIEDVIIRAKEADARVLGIINELPQAWIRQLTEYSSGKKEILLYTTLPPGSFAQIRYYLSKYLHTESDIYISGPENGGWPLTFETLDTEQGIWKWQEPNIIENHKIRAFERATPLKQRKEQHLVTGGFGG